MEHVGIGEQDAGFAAQAAPHTAGCVAIVGAKTPASQPVSGQFTLGQLAQPAELVVGQGLGGKEVEGAGTGAGE